MANRRQFEDALIKADAAGDTEGARVIAEEIKRRFMVQPTTKEKVQASLPGRVLQGARDMIDGGAQLLPRGLEFVSSAGGMAPNPVSNFFGSEARRVDQINAGNEQAYQQARTRTGQEGFDGGRLIGNIVSPGNAAIAAVAPIRAGMGLAQLAGRGAAMGAAGGALTPINDPQAQEDFSGAKAAQVGLGAVTGGILTPAITRGMEPLLRRAPLAAPAVAESRAAQQVDEQITQALRDVGPAAGPVGPDTIAALRRQAMEAARKGRSLDVAALLRQRDFESLGMPSLQGQITRDPMQFARERNLRGIEGVGEPITERLTAQRQTLGDILGRFSRGSTERDDAGQMLVDSLQKTDETLRQNISGLYQQARSSTQADLNIPLTRLAQDAQRVIDDFGDNVPGAVRRTLGDLGLFSGTQRKTFNLLDSDRLLKVINANDPGPMQAPTHRALGELRTALKQTVDDALPAEGNPFRPAVKAAADRFKLQEVLPALKMASDGRANEDLFVNRFLISAKPKQVQSLAQILDPESLGQARAQIGSYLERKAFGLNTTGDKAFSPERFNSALDSLGSKRLSAFFNPQEVEQLRRVGRVGAYIDSPPNASAVNFSNSAGAMGNILSAAGRLPGMSQSLSIAQSLARPVINQQRVTSALSPKVPQTAAQLTPEQERALTLLMGNLGVGAGVFGASPLR
jgi:hypothetical protein